MPRRHTLLLPTLLAAVVSTSACDATCETDPPSLPIVVRDSFDNPVAIDAVAIVRGETRSHCSRPPNQTGLAHCSVSRAGKYSIEVSTQGHVVSKEFEVHADDCALSSYNNFTIIYDGPLCDLAKLIVAEGETLDTKGNPWPAEVSLRAPNKSAPCASQDGHFTCAAIDALTTDYEVVARFSTTTLTRKIQVPLNECSVDQPEHLTFDLSNLECDDSEPAAARVRIRTRSAPNAEPRNALADTVTARDYLGNEQTCTLEPMQHAPAAPAYLCAPTSPRGGGRYTIEAAIGDHTASFEAQIQDDGCQPTTSTIDLEIKLYP